MGLVLRKHSDRAL